MRDDHALLNRSTAIWFLGATAILGVIYAAACFGFPRSPFVPALVTSVGYAVCAAIWAPQRLVSSLAGALRLHEEGEITGFGALREIGAALSLPVYCAVLTLVVRTIYFNVTAIATLEPLSYITLSLAAYGSLAVLTPAVLLLLIWRRREAAGVIALMTALFSGTAIFVAAYIISHLEIGSADDYDTWYGHQAEPRLFWLIFVFLLIWFAGLAIFRLWQSLDHKPRLPWATLLFLVIGVGYAAGLGKITGFWPNSWLIGAFFMSRQATYLFYICEPKSIPFYRASWFACFVAATLLCVAVTAHVLITHNFGMTRFFLLLPIAPIGFNCSPWAFALSLFVYLTRDLLFLIWLNRLRPRGGTDAIGVFLLALLYVIVPPTLASIGIGPLMRGLVPLIVVTPTDFIWPVATIVVLALLIWRDGSGGTDSGSSEAYESRLRQLAG